MEVSIDGLDMGDARDAADHDDAPNAPRTREETRGQKWERLRREARASGMNRREAITYAAREVDRPDTEQPQLDPPSAADQAPAASPSSGEGVQGLGEIPDGWPSLTANAAMPAEVAWVQANRVLVRQGEGVDLSRSLSPAPSYAALSWLETSILYPSKWADVVKAALIDGQADDQADVRREKLALLDMCTLLSEAMPIN